MDADQLFGEVSLALETYRRLLPPGIYFFAPEIKDGKPTGKIIEEREDYQSKEQAENPGVTFGFYPQGFIAEELRQRPVMEWLYKYPFIARVMDLHQAPESFLEALSHHVDRKMNSITVQYCQARKL